MSMNVSKLLSWVAVAALCATSMACDSSAEDYCDAKCECEYCDDYEYDRCVLDRQEEEDRAYDRECGVEWEEWIDCVDATYYCHRDHLEHDCSHEKDRWKHCVD